MRKNLLLLIIFSANYLKAQQVNDVFTPFAKNNEWGNTVINSAQLETSGYITLGGYYEGALNAGFTSGGDYYKLPNKIPLMLQVNSQGVVRSGFGSLVNDVYLMSSVNSNNGSTTIDKTFIANASGTANSNMLIVAGHEDAGKGFLLKTFPTGARPTAFNGGDITTLSGGGASAKGYIEDWHPGSIIYSIRMNGATFGNAKILLAAFSKEIGTPLLTFGDSGTLKIGAPEGSIINASRPARMAALNTSKFYIAFSTTASLGPTAGVAVCRVNFIGGKIDSSFGSNGYKTFPTTPGYNVTSVLVNDDESVIIGGYGDEGQASVPSFFTFKDDGSLSITSYNHSLAEPLPGYGSKNIAAKLASINNEERIVFAYAKPINTEGQFRIAIASHKPGSVATDPLVFSPWLSNEFVSAEPTGIITLLNNTGFIVTGKATRPNGTFAGVVIRYNIDGTLSTGFGDQGVSIINGRQGGSPWADVTQLSDNKYLAVGSAGFLPTAPEKNALIINRFNSDGVADTSFGTNGTLYPYQSDYEREGQQVHALASGKFLIGGTYYNYQNEPGIGTNSKGPKATIYKFNADGSPDNSFGTFQNGKLVFSGYTGLSFKEMQVQDDTIYMAGTTAQSHTGNANAFIYKLTPDGIPYSSYLPYVRGIHTFTISALTGMAYVGGGLNGSPKVICKVKRGTDATGGRPDSSFGTNGIAVIPVATAGEITEIKQIKLRPGAILLASVWAASNSATAVKGLYFTLISQEGIVDPGFGTNGNKFLQLPGATSIIAEHFKWTGQDKNRLLIFGEATVSGSIKGFVCKVDLNGDLDLTFGTGGVTWTTATFEDHIVFDNAGDMIAIKNYAFLNGGALAKLKIPADVYDRIKQGSWTGSINNDWFNAGNWAEAVVPDAYTEVVVANGNVLIGANQHAFAYSVRVLGGANLTVGANSTLEITKNTP